MSIYTKDIVRQTKRAANQPEFDDQLSLPERIVFLLMLLSLMAGWMWLFFSVLAPS